MNKTYRSVLLWGVAALICLIALVTPSYAANLRDIPGFKPGPGDYYDASGKLYAVDGKLLAEADGEIVDYDLAARAKSSAALNGTQTEPAEAKAAETASKQEAVAEAPAEKPQEAPAEKPQEAPAEKPQEAPAEKAPEKPEQGTISSKPASEPAVNVGVVDGWNVYSYEGKKYMADTSYGVHKLSGYCPTPEYGRGTYSGKEARANHTVSIASDVPIGTVVILKGASGPYASDYNGVYVVEDRGGYYIEQEGWIDVFFDTAQEADRVTAAGWNYAEVWIAKEVE